MKKIGIALAGGGSRGIAHSGILKAIDEAGIKIDMVTGTSAGAIVGAFYCSGFRPDELLDLIIKTKMIRYLRPAISWSGLFNLEKFASIFHDFIKDGTFEDLKIPLVVAATNLRSGESTLFSQGKLFPAVLASSAVPIIFKPVVIDGEHFIDGGVLNNLPLEPLRGKCDIVLGSSCNPISTNYKIGKMRSLLERTFLLTINLNTQAKRDKCDLFIEPDELVSYSGADITKAKEIFDIGYRHGKTIIPKIEALL